MAEWNSNPSSFKDGIIVGCSAEQEMLLSWWWMNFRLHNNHPVTFVNFGNMSSIAQQWCADRGELVTIEVPDNLVTPKERIDPQLVQLWDSIHRDMWIIREQWFKKPFALLKSPYERTLWLDLDCQVRGSLSPLFSTCENPAGIAMAKEADWQQTLNLSRKMILPGQQVFNSGVICYKRHSPVITELAKEAPLQNHLYFGDQHLLIHLLYASNLEFSTFSSLYNWSVHEGLNMQAVILHWMGKFKYELFGRINLANNSLCINLTLNTKPVNPLVSD